MIEYKHGNWFCKPANEAEAKEIMDRAVASGAEMHTRWSPDDKAFGVFEGYVSWDDEIGKRYTIEELRKKFTLPCESVEPEAWSPKAGDHVEIDMRDFISDRRETGETATVLSISVNSNGNTVAMIEIDGRNGECDAVNVMVLRPLRTEREKWIDAAVKIHSAHQWTAESFAESLYDAIKSGALKAPEAE